MTRVGVIGPTDYDFFADNIVDSLTNDLGVEAVALGLPGGSSFKNQKVGAAADLARRAYPALEDRVQDRFADKVIAAECDLIINVWNGLTPATIRKIRSATPIVLWFPDHIANIDRGLMFLGDYSTLYLKDPVVVDRVSSLLGISVAYLPEACNPRRHRPIGGTPGDDSGMVLAGNMYPTRTVLLERLDREGVPLRLYGASFSRWLPQKETLDHLHAGKLVLGDEKSRTFRRAQAVLNNLHPSELTSVNCRLFEATATGGAVITERRPVLEDFFTEGEEVLAFSTYDELVKCWRQVENDPDLARRLGDAASARAHAEHTYEHRLGPVIEKHI